MIYELIADSRTAEKVASEYNAHETRFRVLTGSEFEPEPEPDFDPLCDDTRAGERISRGFELLTACERG